MTLRLGRRLVVPLLLLFLALMAGLGSASSAYAADSETLTIDHAQPTSSGVQLLVSVPAGGTVDLSKVAVTVGGTSVDAKAELASTSGAISRTAILAIDTSDSMGGARITEAKKAATAYLESAPANVKIGVVHFDDTVRTAVEPTTDRAPALASVAGLTLARNTALYQGVLGAIALAGPSGENAGERSVLVLSDGKDTTGVPLAPILAQITKSGVKVDAVALAQSDAESQPLRQIAAAGKGTVLNANQPQALTAAFASEADALSRQIVITADVPSSAQDASTVGITVPVGTSDLTASAYLPVRAAAVKATPTVDASPKPVTSTGLSLPTGAVIGGVVAIGVGLIGVVAALAMKKPNAPVEDRIGAQVAAYGVYAANGPGGGPGPGAPPGQMGLAGQARLAAEKALANNRSLEARVASRLEAAGMALKPAEWLLMRGGIALAGAVVGLLVGSGNVVLGVLLLVAGIVGPGIYLRVKRSRRLIAFSQGLADTLQLMSGSLSAGLSLAQSIDTIVREGNEPITSEFKRVVVESRLGVPLEDSLEGVATRMESRDFEWVVMAIRIQREVGGNLAELLLSVAATLREREYLKRHVRALSAEGRLSCYILGGLPPGFLLYLTVTKPAYVHPMYTTPIGWVLCGAMALLLTVGVFWMSKMAKVNL